LSGDLKMLKRGDPAPEPEDGRYHVKEIDEVAGTMRFEWEARGQTFTCWVPQDAFEKIAQQ
jgi:hypothetical protein